MTAQKSDGVEQVAMPDNVSDYICKLRGALYAISANYDTAEEMRAAAREAYDIDRAVGAGSATGARLARNEQECWGQAVDGAFRVAALDDFLSWAENDDLNPGDTIYRGRATYDGKVEDITPVVLSAGDFSEDDERSAPATEADVDERIAVSHRANPEGHATVDVVIEAIQSTPARLQSQGYKTVGNMAGSAPSGETSDGPFAWDGTQAIPGYPWQVVDTGNNPRRVAACKNAEDAEAIASAINARRATTGPGGDSLTFAHEVDGPWRLELNGVTISRHENRAELGQAIKDLRAALARRATAGTTAPVGAPGHKDCSCGGWTDETGDFHQQGCPELVAPTGSAAAPGDEPKELDLDAEQLLFEAAFPPPQYVSITGTHRYIGATCQDRDVAEDYQRNWEVWQAACATHQRCAP